MSATPTMPTTAAPGAPRRARVVWGLTAVGLAATALVVVVRLSSGTGAPTDRVIGSVALLASVVAFLLSGALIAARQPDNLVGWLLMIPGLAVPMSELGNAWLQGMDPAPTTVTPGLWLVLWFCSWAWLLLIFPIFHLLLTFPDGHLLSKRWRVVVALEMVMIITFIGSATLTSVLRVNVNDVTLWSVPNPIGVLGDTFFERVISGPWQLGLLAVTILSVSAIILRYRRGSSEARHQLKWPLLAITSFGVVYGFGAVDSSASSSALWSLAFSLSIAGIPASVAIAVLKYRLYEIDRLISRTISWAIVTGLLVAVFVLGVVALQAVLGGYIQGQTLPVAASTLVAFALFQPVRRHVQGRIDRRFNRARYDAQQTADGFAGRLRDEVDLSVLLDELTRTTTDTVQPRSTTIWLRGHGAT